jgi:hypothetical protein
MQLQKGEYLLSDLIGSPAVEWAMRNSSEERRCLELMLERPESRHLPEYPDRDQPIFA